MTQQLKPTGHPSLNSTVFSDEQWTEWQAHDLCAEEKCLSAAEAGGEEEYGRTGLHPKDKLIRGRVWYKNGSADESFGPIYRKYCFTCAFWHNQASKDRNNIEDPSLYPFVGVIVEEVKSSSPVFGDVIEMVHYCFNENTPIATGRSDFLGHGGRSFYIQFDGDNKVIVTNNLWYQGVIPEWLRYLFDTNASFRSPE
jgi:hypothetical protein